MYKRAFIMTLKPINQMLYMTAMLAILTPAEPIAILIIIQKQNTTIVKYRLRVQFRLVSQFQAQIHILFDI
jgi:hypothetical protein